MSEKIKSTKPQFIGDHPQEDAALLRQAAKDTGFRIEVRVSTISAGYVGLWHREQRDTGPYFARFHELKQAAAERAAGAGAKEKEAA